MILMDGMAIYYLKEGPGGSWQEMEVDRCRGWKMPHAFTDPARTESHGSAFLMPFRQQAVGEEGREGGCYNSTEEMNCSTSVNTGREHLENAKRRHKANGAFLFMLRDGLRA